MLLHDKAKDKAPVREKKDVRINYTPWPKRDFFPKVQKPRPEMVSSLYKELVYQIMEKIKISRYIKI